MVARRDEARANPIIASRLLLRLAGIHEPTVDDEAAALLGAEFVLKVCRNLPW